MEEHSPWAGRYVPHLDSSQSSHADEGNVRRYARSQLKCVSHGVICLMLHGRPSGGGRGVWHDACGCRLMLAAPIGLSVTCPLSFP